MERQPANLCLCVADTAGLQKLSGANADFWIQAGEFASNIPDPQNKALFLAVLSEVMMEEGLKDDAARIWSQAMKVAAISGQDTVLKVLGHGARLLARANDGLVLSRIHDEALTNFGRLRT